MLRDVAVEYFKRSRVIPAQELAGVLLKHDKGKMIKMKLTEIEEKLSTKQGLQVGHHHNNPPPTSHLAHQQHTLNTILPPANPR